MTGIEMALKSIGVDPAKLKLELQESAKKTVDEVMAKVNKLQATMDRVERSVEAIRTALENAGAELEPAEPSDEHSTVGMLDSVPGE